MSKRGKRFDEDMLENRIIVSLIIIVAIVVASIGYIWISNSVKSKTNNDGQIAKQNNANESINSVEDNKNTNENSESASSSIGKTVEDSKSTNDQNTEEDNTTTNQMIDLTNNDTVSKNTTENTENNNAKENTENQADVSSKPEETKPSFIMPSDGEILKGFSKENLVFSETLQEWITHQALDIKASSRDVVKCSADGTVKSIKSDPRYGLTVIVEHSAGFQTIYSNLLTAEFVVEGEEVKQGQTLGTVGSSAVFEIADESHLHFEMLLNSEYVDPSLYINQ